MLNSNKQDLIFHMELEDPIPPDNPINSHSLNNTDTLILSLEKLKKANHNVK